MAVERRPREAWVNSRLREKHRARSIVSAGLDDDRGGAASAVSLAFARSTYHRLAHRSKYDTQPAQDAPSRLLASWRLDRPASRRPSPRKLINAANRPRTIEPFGQVQAIEALLAVGPAGWGVGDPQPQRHVVPVVSHEQPPARVGRTRKCSVSARRALLCARANTNRRGAGCNRIRVRGLTVVVPGGLQDVKLTGSG